MSNIFKLPDRKLETNVVYCADNFEVMKQLPSESIDLIYIDPPFGTNSLRKSKTWDQEVQGLSFYDSAGRGIKTYVSFMTDRLEHMHRLLKKTGSIYVHLDWRAVHYIKCKMDEIFGEKNFRNEIIWKRDAVGKGAKKTSNQFSRELDSILFYTKSHKHCFNKIYSSDFGYTQLKEFRYKEKDGRKYKIVTLGDYTKKSINKMKSQNLIHTTKTGKEYKKYYLDKFKMIIGSFWGDIPNLSHGRNPERIGYPTQKPLALLERIITASSNPGDIVADFFCGCGTTLSAAQKLGRKWLGVDANTEASKEIRKRMAKDHNMKIDITPLKNLTKAEVLKLSHFEFEKYCVRCIGGIPNDKPVNDGGIDGKLIKDGTPIQVKQSSKIGRPVIDNFHKHFRRNGRGIIIALSFSKGAKEEAHRLKVDEGKELKLITLDSLLSKGTGVAA